MVAYAVLFACLVFIVFVEGPLQPFWIWNALPLGLTAVFLALVRRRRASVIPTAAFGLGSVGLTVYAHMAWLFDWGGTASGSSTSAFLFVFLPIVAIGGGVALWLIARLGLLFRR